MVHFICGCIFYFITSAGNRIWRRDLEVTKLKMKLKQCFFAEDPGHWSRVLASYKLYFRVFQMSCSCTRRPGTVKQNLPTNGLSIITLYPACVPYTYHSYEINWNKKATTEPQTQSWRILTSCTESTYTLSTQIYVAIIFHFYYICNIFRSKDCLVSTRTSNREVRFPSWFSHRCFNFPLIFVAHCTCTRYGWRV